MKLAIATSYLVLIQPTLGFAPSFAFSFQATKNAQRQRQQGQQERQQERPYSSTQQSHAKTLLGQRASRQEESALKDLDDLLQHDAFLDVVDFDKNLLEEDNDNHDDDDDDDDDDLMGVLMQEPERTVVPYEGTEASALADFVLHLLQTPLGLLQNENVALLRNVMTEYAAINDAETVQSILFRMMDEYKALLRMGTNSRILTPTDEDFQLAMATWKDTTGENSSNMVTSMAELFLQQQNMFDQGIVPCKPSMETVKLIMSTLTYSRDRGSDRRVHAMLEQLTTWGLVPDSQIMGYVILALAKSKQNGSAERAQRLLKESVERYQLVPPIEAFNAILTAWAKSGLEDGPQQAEQLLIYMEQIEVNPTIMSFTSLIDAYAQTNTWEGVYQAESILNRLLEQYLQDNQSPEPNVASWTIVISAWTRLARRSNKGAPPKADALLKRMEELQGRITCKPDAITYIQVMNAWVASKMNTERAEEILNEMHERYLDGDDDMKPSPRSVRAVVEAWVKSESIKGMNQAEALLHRVKDIEEMQRPSDEVKDIYKHMIFGWSKLEDPFRAHEYLVEMIKQDLQPDSFCFDRIIESLTQDGGEQALQLTYQVMETMEALRKEGALRPNERVYTSFIRALTKRQVPGCAKKAMLVLRKMQELAESDRNKGMEPTVFTYNAVLYACAESKMKDNAAANLESFKIAIGVFNELRALEKEKADHVTYGNILRCAALLPDGSQRNAVLTSTFQLACKEGYVNQFVIRDLQSSAPEGLWRALTLCPVGDFDWETMPTEWKRGFERKEKKPEFPREGFRGIGRGSSSGRGGGGGRGSGRGGQRGGRSGGGGGRSERRY